MVISGPGGQYGRIHPVWQAQLALGVEHRQRPVGNHLKHSARPEPNNQSILAIQGYQLRSLYPGR